MFDKVRKISQKLSGNPFVETLKHTKNYLISSIANEGLKFVSIPVFTYLLTPEDYGIINIFSTYVAIFSILLVLNLNGAISRYYYEEKDDFKEFLGFSISLAFSVFSFSFAALLLFRSQIASWLELPVSVIPYFIPAVLLGIIASIFSQVFQPRKETKKIRKLAIAQTYIGFALAVVFILLQKNELYLGRLKGDVAIFLIFGFIKLRDVLKFTSFKFKFNKIHLKYILAFSIPNIPYLLSGLILSQFDRIMINNIDGAKDAGLYSFAYNIAMLQLMVSNSLHNAWTPNYYAFMNRKNYEDMDKESHLIIKIITLSTIALIFFAKEIGMLLSSSGYHSALYVIPIILIGHFFVGLGPFNKNAILYSKKTYITALMTLSAGALNIILNSIYIPKFGYEAAAITTGVSYFYLYLAELLIAKYVLRFHIFSPLKMKGEFFILGISVLLYYYLFNQDFAGFTSFLLKIIVISTAAVAIFWGMIYKNLLTLKK
jgi:O-antigen/teichoic acid export membrane protein